MRRGLLAIALVLGVAACGGGSSSTLSVGNLGKYVLQRGDLGQPFEAFSNGPQIRIDNQGTPRADPSRFGREGGWIARYKRAGTSKTVGPLVAVSRVDLFKDRGGASSDLAEYRRMFAAQPGVSPHAIAVPRIGDAAIGMTFSQTGLLPVRYFSVAWRYRNATASVTVEGWAGKIGASDAVALARKQQARLRHG